MQRLQHVWRLLKCVSGLIVTPESTARLVHVSNPIRFKKIPRATDRDCLQAMQSVSQQQNKMSFLKGADTGLKV